jgi:hypothetical protein
MSCIVTKDGALSNCMVTQESPEGLGFGEAELNLASQFKMLPTTISGAPVGGASVTVPMKWVLSDDPPAIAPNGLIRAPTQAQFATAYPKQAWDANQDGKVTLKCAALPSGYMTDCGIGEESPAGAGFGAAAMKLSPFFQMGSASIKGGQAVTLSLVWSTSGSFPALPSPLPRRDTKPGDIDWLSKPDSASFGRAYPERAARMEKSGRAVMKCQLGADGFLTGCQITLEEPAGYGFAEATLKLAPMFQMGRSPPRPLEPGGTVTVPMTWALQ